MAEAIDLLDDDNSDVKGAIAQRQSSAVISQEELTTLLRERLTPIMPDAKKRSTFVGQLEVLRQQNPKIADCSAESIVNCFIACGHLDLMPNVKGTDYAYIIPYGKEAQFQLGYKGLMELAYRSGAVSSINAELVFADDTFEVSLGGERTLTHKPNYFSEIDRTKYENIKAVYATATLIDGKTVFHVMTMGEITKIRESSKAGKGADNPWTKWPEKMALKTVIKQMLKLLPASTHDNRFKEAINYDDRAEGGKLDFNEDGSLNLDAKPTDYEAPTKPKDKGVKNYAKDYSGAAEAEVVDDDTGMTKEELISSINELMNDMLQLSEEQQEQIFKAAGTHDLSELSKANLTLIFKKLDDMLPNEDEGQPDA